MSTDKLPFLTPENVVSWVQIGSTRYTVIDKPTVTAGTEAEKLCNSQLQGGILAEITNPSLKDSLLSLARRYKLDKQDYWIAGKNLINNGISKSGPYWIKTSKLHISQFTFSILFHHHVAYDCHI